MADEYKEMKEVLKTSVSGQLGRLDKVSADELGKVVDMIKDLEEASYYCAVIKAMEDKKEREEESPMMYYSEAYPRMRRPIGYDDYWRDMDKIMYDKMYYTDQPRDSQGRYTESGRGGRNYYDGGSSSSSGSSNGGGMSSGSGTRGYYTQMPFPMEWRDEREGRSPRSRKMYMESKEMHSDKETKIQDLERYMQELSADIVDMIKDASPEEQKTLQIKLNELASKLK